MKRRDSARKGQETADRIESAERHSRGERAARIKSPSSNKQRNGAGAPRGSTRTRSRGEPESRFAPGGVCGSSLLSASRGWSALGTLRRGHIAIGQRFQEGNNVVFLVAGEAQVAELGGV